MEQMSWRFPPNREGRIGDPSGRAICLHVQARSAYELTLDDVSPELVELLLGQALWREHDEPFHSLSAGRGCERSLQASLSAATLMSQLLAQLCCFHGCVCMAAPRACQARALQLMPLECYCQAPICDYKGIGIAM